MFTDRQVSHAMEVIELSDEFTQAVLDSLKVSTIRYGRRNYKLGNAILRTPSRSMHIRVHRICYCQFEDLTEEDAQRDGFRSREALSMALRGFYPHIMPTDEMTIVYFSLMETM